MSDSKSNRCDSVILDSKLQSMIEAAEAHRQLQLERGRADIRAGRFLERCGSCQNAYPDSLLTGETAGGEPVCEHCIAAEAGGEPW